MEKCLRCNNDLILESNFMLSELYGENLSEEDDAIVTYAHCPYCGAKYEFTDTPESEKKDYPYWKKEDNDGYVGDLFENDEVFNT